MTEETLNREYLNIINEHSYLSHFVNDLFIDNININKFNRVTERFGYYTKGIDSMMISYISEISKTKKKIYILDLGIGLGIYMRTIKKIAGLYNVEVIVVGVELEKEFCNFAKNVVCDSIIIRGDITKLTLSKISKISNVDKFDLVYSWCPITKKSDVLKLFTNIIKEHKYYDTLDLNPAHTNWGRSLDMIVNSKLFKTKYGSTRFLSKTKELTKEDISKLIIDINSIL